MSNAIFYRPNDQGLLKISEKRPLSIFSKDKLRRVFSEKFFCFVLTKQLKQETRKQKPYLPTQVIKHKNVKVFGAIILKELCKMTSELREKMSLLW